MEEKGGGKKEEKDRQRQTEREKYKKIIFIHELCLTNYTKST